MEPSLFLYINKIFILNAAVSNLMVNAVLRGEEINNFSSVALQLLGMNAIGSTLDSKF